MIGRHRRVGAAVVCTLTVLAAAGSLAACSGEERLSPDAFCDEFVAIDSSAGGSGEGIASALEALAPRAPTAELGDAVSVVAEVFAAFGRVANEGGDAGAELARLGEDPAVVEAVTTFGDFLTEECGLDLGLPGGDGTVPAG